MKNIGEIIKKTRNEQGLSAEKVAAQAGVSYKSVLNIEQGKDATTKVLSAICKVLGLEVSLKSMGE